MQNKHTFLLRRKSREAGEKRTQVRLQLTPTHAKAVGTMAGRYLETFSFDVRITPEARTIAGQIGHDHVKKATLDACMRWYQNRV